MNYEEECKQLITQMKMTRFLTSSAVESALREIPRHLFIPNELRRLAYVDTALPTKNGQTISQPSVVARMTELLDVKEGQKILEVGTGSGWQSAILSHLVGKQGEVFSIDSNEKLIAFAKRNLRKVGRTNVHVVLGDGSVGLEPFAPYERIIVTAAAPDIPSSLVKQLRSGGRMVIPVGRNIQELVVVRKDGDGNITVESEGVYRFVPLVGKEGFKEKGVT